MNYSKLVKNYIRSLKRKTGYVSAESSEEKQNFINEGLNALFIAIKDDGYFSTDLDDFEKVLTYFGYTKLDCVSLYKVRSAQQFISFNMGMFH